MCINTSRSLKGFKSQSAMSKKAQTMMTAMINAPATWVCLVCGWCYDERTGDLAGGIAPGTRWCDVPEDWLCPDCGVNKTEFEMVQI